MSLMSTRVARCSRKPFPSPNHGITPLAALLFCMMNFGSLQSAHAEEIREPEKIIGDLGGMPISVSSSIVGRSGAKYEDYLHPSFKNPLSIRTYQSKLKFLGFHMRFSDRTLLTQTEAESLKLNGNITDTPLLSIGILSGDTYKYGDLPHIFYVFNEHFKNKELWFTPKKIEGKTYGLSAYQLVAESARTSEPIKGYKTTKTGYFERDHKNSIKTSIFCANPKNETTKCFQGWDMEDRGVRVFVQVEYRTGLLKHWQDIREVVTQAILKLRVDPTKLGELPFCDSVLSRNSNAE